MPHHWRPLAHERNSIFKCKQTYSQWSLRTRKIKPRPVVGRHLLIQSTNILWSMFAVLVYVFCSVCCLCCRLLLWLCGPFRHNALNIVSVYLAYTIFNISSKDGNEFSWIFKEHYFTSFNAVIILVIRIVISGLDRHYTLLSGWTCKTLEIIHVLSV